MDSATFAFYLSQTPAEYTAVDDLVTQERVLDDLRVQHGGPRARDLGLAFLAQELRDCATGQAAGGALAELAPAMLALLRQLLALYDGQRLSPPEYFASYWRGVREMIRQAEAGAAPGPDQDGAAILGKLDRLPASDRALVLDMLDRLLEDLDGTRTANNAR